MTKGERAAWEAMQLVQNEAIALIRAYPDMAKHVATGLLGIGCAFADAYGVDAVAFVTALRDQKKKTDIQRHRDAFEIATLEQALLDRDKARSELTRIKERMAEVLKESE